MAIAFVAASSAGVTGTTLTVPKPTGTLQGHVMVAAIGARNATTVTCTPPAGWDLVASQNRGTAGKLFVYSKDAEASEPASYDFILSLNFEHIGEIITYSGVDTTAPVEASGTSMGSTAVTTHSTPQVASISQAAEVLRIAASAASGTTPQSYTWPASTERIDATHSGTATVFMSMASLSRASAANGSTETATPSVSANYATATVILRPAPATSGAGTAADVVSSWWTLPRAVATGGKVFTGGVRADGTVAVVALDDTGSERVSLATFGADDHNTPSFLVQSGKRPWMFYADHNGGTPTLYRHQAVTEGDLLRWGARQTKDGSAGGQHAYVQAFAVPASNTIYVFVRIANETWHVFKSTDWGATFSASIEFIDFGTSNQGYIALRQLADGNLRMVAYGHPTLSTIPDIRYCDINITTGAITKIDGTSLGNLDGTSLPLAPSSLDLVYDATTEGVRLFDISDGPEREIAFATWTNDTNTMYRYLRHDGSSWQTPINVVAAGVVFGGDVDAHYVGGMSFPEDTPGDVVYLSRESSGTWTIERADRNGSTFDLTVQATAPGGHKYIRPYALAPGSTPYDLVYVDVTTYTDYTTYAGGLQAMTAIEPGGSVALRVGEDTPSAAYLGEDPVDAIYLGATQVL